MHLTHPAFADLGGDGIGAEGGAGVKGHELIDGDETLEFLVPVLDQDYPRLRRARHCWILFNHEKAPTVRSDIECWSVVGFCFSGCFSTRLYVV